MLYISCYSTLFLKLFNVVSHVIYLMLFNVISQVIQRCISCYISHVIQRYFSSYSTLYLMLFNAIYHVIFRLVNNSSDSILTRDLLAVTNIPPAYTIHCMFPCYCSFSTSSFQSVVLIIVGIITIAFVMASTALVLQVFCHRLIEVAQFNDWSAYLKEMLFRITWLSD